MSGYNPNFLICQIPGFSNKSGIWQRSISEKY
jgi:hypothetical protein